MLKNILSHFYNRTTRIIMHIAILCSGRIQAPSMPDTISHFQHLRQAMAPASVTFFFSLNQAITDLSYVTTFCDALHISREECVSVTPTHTPPIIYTFRKAPETKYDNVWSMYTHNQRAFQLMEAYEQKHGARFDTVIKYRADLASATPLALPSSLLQPQTVYIPEVEDWGGVNDQIALGHRDSMKQYCDAIDNIIPMCQAGTLYHPETLLLAHLRTIHMCIQRFPFRYQLLGRAPGHGGV